MVNFAVMELNPYDKDGERERLECPCPCKHQVRPTAPAMGAGAGPGWFPAVLAGALSRDQLMKDGDNLFSQNCFIPCKQLVDPR